MDKIERCPKCNANLAMVGRSHRCVPTPEWAGGVPKKSGGGTESRRPARSEALAGSPVSDEVGNAGTGLAAKPASRSTARVAPGPPDTEPKKKRAPRGTFDRKTYQRDLMRKRRQEEADRLARIANAKIEGE